MTNKYFSAAETAKLVRQSLKEAFAGVSFSVTSKTYSGGASVRVGWTDGPNDDQVKAVVGKFTGSYFDSSLDYQGSVFHMVDGQRATFAVDHLFTSRDFSDASVQRAIDRFSRRFAGNLKQDGIEKPTVAQWRSGDLHSMHLLSRSVHSVISGFLQKNTDRLRVGKSKTAGRVFVTHDDGYGRAMGTGGGSRELAHV